MQKRLNVIAGWIAAALRLAPEIIGVREVFLFAGLFCLARGLYMVFPPAAWMVVGLVLIAVALRRAAE